MSVRTLVDLSPSEFENLAYDLLLASGFRDLIWRTPGADGGRDIEGTISFADAVGEEVRQKWYVECKRYQSSVDWPTVYSKIPYADNHNADYLLMVSTANPSPKCEDEIKRWNENGDLLKIRFWRGYQISSLLRSKIQVGVKYGLIDRASEAPISLKNITSISMKAAQSASAAFEFGRDPVLSLEASSSCAELVFQRTSEIEKYGRPVFMLDRASSLPSWVHSERVITDFDGIGLLALLSYYRYCTYADFLNVEVNGNDICVNPIDKRLDLSVKAREDLQEISLWADVELGFSDESMSIIRR